MRARRGAKGEQEGTASHLLAQCHDKRPERGAHHVNVLDIHKGDPRRRIMRRMLIPLAPNLTHRNDGRMSQDWVQDKVQGQRPFVDLSVASIVISVTTILI
jgi:hypothetical protein